MILRRVIEHVKAQNWFAVAIDFAIVVIGVFVGLQVNNWNAARQQAALGDAYLVRLSADLSAMEAYLEDMIGQSSMRYDLSVDLLQAASNGDGDGDALVAAAEAFFTKGWKTPRFTIIDAVYRDLTSTGNLALIEPDLREKITMFYADLDIRREQAQIGRDWSLPNDSRFIIDYDVYRWDLSLARLALADDPVIQRATIIAAREDLARLAAMSVYIERPLLDDYKTALAGAEALTAAIAGKEKGAP